MRKLFVLLSFFGCTTPNENSSQTESPKMDTSVTKQVSTKISTKDSIRSVLYQDISAGFESQPFVQGDEEWTYGKISEEYSLVGITRYKNETKYQELFGLLNEELVFAYEACTYNYQDSSNMQRWNVRYVIDGDSIIDYISLGHGETEGEGWEPESILDQWESRRDGYNQLLTIVRN